MKRFIFLLVVLSFVGCSRISTTVTQEKISITKAEKSISIPVDNGVISSVFYEHFVENEWDVKERGDATFSMKYNVREQLNTFQPNQYFGQVSIINNRTDRVVASVHFRKKYKWKIRKELLEEFYRNVDVEGGVITSSK